MNIVVQKYGGACLETPEKLRAVAASVAETHQKGVATVVIVSAMGKATDDLVRLAYQVSPHPNRRELDMLLTTGERVSMALMSMALTDLGVPAISFTGSQAGVMTDDSHSQARILDVRPTRVREELARGRVVVLAGFQGVNPSNKEITTLGRGGSDTTAVAMAAALKADRCEIIKEVDGVCTADPRLVREARAIARLDYAALGEMCFWGAKVLHFRSIELAMSQEVPLIIRRWGQSGNNTQVLKEVKGMEEGKVLSINSIARVEHLAVEAPDMVRGFERISRHLKSQSLAWPQVLASVHEGSETRVMITSDPEHLDTLFRTATSAEGFKRLREPMSSVTVTCHGAVGPELSNRVFEILGNHGVMPAKYIHSPHSITVFLKVTDRETAVRALHVLV